MCSVLFLFFYQLKILNLALDPINIKNFVDLGGHFLATLNFLGLAKFWRHFFNVGDTSNLKVGNPAFRGLHDRSAACLFVFIRGRLGVFSQCHLIFLLPV
jgi:hypothetical protein